jgi:predicted metal-binding protein
MAADRCICCGEIIPEGRMVCKTCEEKYTGDNKQDPEDRREKIEQMKESMRKSLKSA